MTRKNPEVGTFVLDTEIGQVRRETHYPNFVYLHPNGRDEAVRPIGQPGTPHVTSQGVLFTRRGVPSVVYPWQPIGQQKRDCGAPHRTAARRGRSGA